ncbi:MAG: choice-of-anchor V domain-containing protein [Blastocatellia bacterium]
MSSKKFVKLIVALLSFSVFIFVASLKQPRGALAFSSGPDPARTGAPGELTCATAECHGTARAIDPQRFSITAPATYEPGRTYKIKVRHVSGDATRRRWGFQITALAAAGVRAGIWQNFNNDTQIVEDNFLNREYAQHSLAGSFAGQSGGASWTINWTAPTTNVGRVTFYAAGNQADDNNNSSGDQILTAQAVSNPGQPSLPIAATPGSLLVFNLFTSQASNRARQDSRINLTNTHETNAVTLRLLLIDGDSGAITNSFVRLTPLQTTSLLASDLDPGLTGYLLAMACDQTTGCPVSFNHLLGDEYVKLASGHAANLKAESFSLSPAASPCLNASTAELRFDGFDYNRAPRMLALTNLASRANGNDTLLIVNRLGGDWRNVAMPIGALQGTLFDDAEKVFSFSAVAGSCQLLVALNDQTLRTTPSLNQIIPAARSGWMKLWAANEISLSGAAINLTPQTKAISNAFNQGHNLHHLSLTSETVLTLPITPPQF